MNTRPSRVPSPTQTYETEHRTEFLNPDRDADAVREMIEQREPAQLPANRLPETEMHSSPIMSVRDEAATVREPPRDIGQLIGAIAAVMAEITPVEKGGWNTFHKYAFARIQDLLGTLTPLMGKHGIVIWQNEEGRELFDGGKCVAVRYRFTVTHKSGQIWTDLPLQTGMSNCRDTKGGFDDKALNKCHTAARKYFLLSLFQIPTEDMADADAEGKPPTAEDGKRQPRPQGRRPVPSPDGKVPPHILPVIEGEAPAAWAARFGAFVSKASSRAEIDAWYDANKAVFEKLQNADEQVYNDALDFMDACERKLVKPADDRISSGLGNQAPDLGHGDMMDGADFPGDKKMTSTAEWLAELEETFAKCTDSEELAEEQKNLMLPSKDTVTKQTWAAAVAIVKKHLERIQNA